jgi:flagellar motor switch protein FliN/FliY
MSTVHIERFGDLPLRVESVIGRSMLPVREILALGPGSIIKLSAPAGSHAEVLVGGAPFGSGEVVRSGGAPAVRLLNFEKKKAH